MSYKEGSEDNELQGSWFSFLLYLPVAVLYRLIEVQVGVIVNHNTSEVLLMKTGGMRNGFGLSCITPELNLTFPDSHKSTKSISFNWPIYVGRSPKVTVFTLAQKNYKLIKFG